MRARLFGVAACILMVGAAQAGPKLTPAEIQAMFFTGQPFTAASPSGTKFKMMFNADGKMNREPLARSGIKGEGTWKLDQGGFCTTWKGQAPNCYTLVMSGNNKWSVMKKSAMMAVWSK